MISHRPSSAGSTCTRFAVCLLILIGCTSFAYAQGAERHGPPSPLPAFSLIDGWEEKTALADATVRSNLSDVALDVMRLCRYYGVSYDEMSPVMANLSPLEWPRVFAGQTANPRRMRAENERLLELNRLAFRPIITLEPREMTDSLARAITQGSPVLLNSPEAPIIYGYDRREPDPWWWVQWRDRTEILFESERLSSLVYWADDPAANVAWAITSADSEAMEVLRDERARGFAWLRTVTESVQGDPAIGLRPYPLTLRAFRDSVATSPDVPRLREPIRASDPLGLRRARNMRGYAVELLEWLTATATDTLLSRPLRLSLYYYHNAVESLNRLDTLLYDARKGSIPAEVYQSNWRNEVRKSQMVATITDLLEWEKQAAEQLMQALSARRDD